MTLTISIALAILGVNIAIVRRSNAPGRRSVVCRTAAERLRLATSIATSLRRTQIVEVTSLSVAASMMSLDA